MKREKYADIIDVANHAGVSPATVSRSFNHPSKVKADTRNRIQKAVDATGYIRNRAAQAIHGIRSGTIGLIVPTLDNAIFANLIQAFSEKLYEGGFTMLVATHHYDLKREYQLLRSLLEHRVEGIGLIGLDHKEETYALLETRKTPAVTMWNFSRKSRLPCVGSDNYQAGKMIAEYVIDKGHRKIGLVFPAVQGNDRAAQRTKGVMDALNSHGIEVPDIWRVQTKYSIKHSRQTVTPILAAEDGPTAIIAGNDVIAHGVIFAAHAADLHVPRDISVTGIGDFSGSSDFFPSLTTVRLRSQTIGSTAADELIGQINRTDSYQSRNLEIELRLMQRESC